MSVEQEDDDDDMFPQGNAVNQLGSIWIVFTQCNKKPELIVYAWS